jgi:hypothetical protein
VPVDLKALPDKFDLPAPPRAGRWCLIVLLCSFLGGAVVVLLWPDDSDHRSLWFWSCALVLPLMSGLLLFALRQSAHERRCDYLRGWNQVREEKERALIQQGQRDIALLATSYATAAGNNKVAEALRKGSKPLSPAYIKAQAQTMRLSPLDSPVPLPTQDQYRQRISKYLQQVMCGLEPEMRCVGDAPLRVRIRHDQVLDDPEVLSLWRAHRGNERMMDQVTFATQDDGLLWLDTWLDDQEADQPVLSLEFNLFLEPVPDHAESVSALLLAPSQWCTKQNITPLALIHRPVRITHLAEDLEDALLWARVPPASNEYSIWQTQMPVELRTEIALAMSKTGRLFDIAKSHLLDDSLGLPGCAVGHVALIVASEQAATEREAQLVMLQDASPQVCVIQPA